MSDVQVLHGDALELLPTLDAASVDSVCTDPPYELAFMGRQWDASGIAYNVDLWRECLRVLKPGGYLLAFGGTRTHHRLACAVEDAGFEIRDSIAWLYGSGFPKSLDVSKAIDRDNGRKFEDRYALGQHIRERRTAAGLTPDEVNTWFGYRTGCQHWESQSPGFARVPTAADYTILKDRLGLSDTYDDLVARAEAEREIIELSPHSANRVVESWFASGNEGARHVTAPATDDARRWQGWGTALKPAHEPIVVARKPLAGTVAANVLAHGTGALNIDGCRVDMGDEYDPTKMQRQNAASISGFRMADSAIGRETPTYKPGGRWPPNVVLDEAAAAELDRQSGTSISPGNYERTTTVVNHVYGVSNERPVHNGHGDSGGASRFFPTFRYEAKAPADQRPRVNGTSHPTVKPLDLMRWLVRLVTPPGGTVLDPFAGSGTTGEACLIEGFQCVLIEREADYLPLIRARLDKPIQPTLMVQP